MTQFLADLQALDRQGGAFAFHLGLGTGDLGIALGPVGHLLHQRQALHGHGLTCEAEAVHAADGKVLDTDRELGIRQRSRRLPGAGGCVNLQPLGRDARAVLLRQIQGLCKAQGVGLVASQADAGQQDPESAQAQLAEVAHLYALRDGVNALVRRQALAGSAEGDDGHGGPRNEGARSQTCANAARQRARRARSIPKDLMG